MMPASACEHCYPCTTPTDPACARSYDCASRSRQIKDHDKGRRKIVSKDFVRYVLKEYAEADMPHGKDPWPAIRERLQPGNLEPATASSTRPVVSDLLQPQTTASPRVGRTT